MFKIGNVVRLRHRTGPDMTIDYADEDVVECIWFNKEDELMEARFRSELLELVRE